MVQGTSSGAGKTTVATALCRLFSNRGFKVAPFKAQNMSSNSVRVRGGEMSVAQAVQAIAARAVPEVDMNPVLLKPRNDRTSQMVVLGQPWEITDARDYNSRRDELWPVVADALDRLRSRNDVVIIEGAGSPAEVNLARYDIVNMSIALYADAPVILVGDIERGGVFASLYGTHQLLRAEERSMIRAFLINKFRGDASLLDPGFELLEDLTGVSTIGVLPWLAATGLPEEDERWHRPEGRDYDIPVSTDISVAEHDGNTDSGAAFDRLSEWFESNINLTAIDAIAGLSETTMSERPLGVSK